MQTIIDYFKTLPVAVIAGLGIYFVVAELGRVFGYVQVYALNSYGGNGFSDISIITIALVTTAFGVTGVWLGALFAGLNTKNSGKRDGRMVAIIVAAFLLFFYLLVEIRPALFTFDQRFAAAPPAFLWTQLSRIPITIILMFFAGQKGGLTGERFAQARNDETQPA
jgi:hypothetical protein